MWSREVGRGVRKERQRPIEEKESIRWLESLEISQSLVPDSVEIITVADREADIFELFAHPRRANSELLIRAAQNRNTKRSEFSEEVQPLFSVIAASPVSGELVIDLQRTPRRKARPAFLTVRFAQVWLQPPAHLKDLTPIAVWAVLAEEDHPPEKEKLYQFKIQNSKFKKKRQTESVESGVGPDYPNLGVIAESEDWEPFEF